MFLVDSYVLMIYPGLFPLRELLRGLLSVFMLRLWFYFRCIIVFSMFLIVFSFIF
jgi:hypothetical protein